MCIRNTVQKFEELACKVAIEGGTMNVALLSLSGIFFQYSFYLAATLVSFGSMFTTICFIIMTSFYSKLLEISVETAKKMEDDIFPKAWDSTQKEMGKKLTHNLDEYGKILGMRLAGKHTWKVVLSVFIGLFTVGAILFFVYLLYTLNLFPLTDC